MLHPGEENVIALNTSVNSWEKFFFHPGVRDEEKLNNGNIGNFKGKKNGFCVDSTEQELPPP